MKPQLLARNFEDQSIGINFMYEKTHINLVIHGESLVLPKPTFMKWREYERIVKLLHNHLLSSDTRLR